MKTDNSATTELRSQLEDFDAAIKAQEEIIADEGDLPPYKLSLKHLNAERQNILDELIALDPIVATCQCRQCLRDRKEGSRIGKRFLPAEMSRMILCEVCSNKRCPHATDHRHACTGSNDAGQIGSSYGESS